MFNVRYSGLGESWYKAKRFNSSQWVNSLDTWTKKWSIALSPLKPSAQHQLEAPHRDWHRLPKGFDSIFWPSLVAQAVKYLPAMQETQSSIPGWEDPLEKGMATHPSSLACRIPQRSPAGCNPWGHKESDTTELVTHTYCSQSEIKTLTVLRPHSRYNFQDRLEESEYRTGCRVWVAVHLRYAVFYSFGCDGK